MRSCCDADAEPITRARKARAASCTAKEPTPPPAPWTSTVSSGPTSSRSSAWNAVSPASGSDAASSHDRSRGFRAAARTGTVVYSAKVPRCT